MVKYILSILLLLALCAAYVPEKHFYSSEIPGTHGGHFKSTSTIPIVILEKSIVIDSVHLPDSLFYRESAFPYQVGEIIDHISEGSERYLFMYRHYRSACCDSKDVGTIVFLICIEGERYNMKRSIILDTGPWQFPHNVYWPEKITSYEIDNSMTIFTKNHDGEEQVFNGMVTIDWNGTIDEYIASKKRLKEKS